MFIAFLISVAASSAAAAHTERSSFCETACHEMRPYGRSWESSAHNDVACVECHIKPGALEFVKAKGSALREVYVHFTGEDKAPIAVTEHFPNSTCEESGCLPQRTIRDPVPLPSASAVASPNPAARPAGSAPPVALSHAQHAKVPLCIECYSQVVHRRVPGKPYLDPTTMAYCLRCHDGKQASRACETCHAPAHAPRGACTKCHSLASWSSTFSHPAPLGAQHKTVICEKCHTKATNAVMGFPAGCAACHAKPHKDVKTLLCATCHLSTHWKPSTFKHPKTGMDGWQSMACTQCHPNNAFAKVYCTCHGGNVPSGD